MKINGIVSGIRIIIGNYQKIIKNTFLFTFYIALIITTSLVITLPIWYLATKYSRIYTFLVITALLIFSGLYISRNIRTWLVSKQKMGISTSKIILIPLKKLSAIALFILCLYVIIFLYSRGVFFAAIPLSIAYLLILGYFIFIYRKNNANTTT